MGRHTNGIKSSITVHVEVFPGGVVLVIEISLTLGTAFAEMSADGFGSEFFTSVLHEIEVTGFSWHFEIFALVNTFNGVVVEEVSGKLIKWDLIVVRGITLENFWQFSGVWLHVVSVFIDSSWETIKTMMPSGEIVFVLNDFVKFLLITHCFMQVYCLSSS